MRDPNRIDRVLALISSYWKLPGHSDLRLAQIIGNLSGLRDPYCYEDDKLESDLKMKIEAAQNPPTEFS